MGVIATIDGMCGTFKSRTAKDIAECFNWSSINCGMIYRAITSFGYGIYGNELMVYSKKITNQICGIKIYDSFIEINGEKYLFSKLRTHEMDVMTSSLANEIMIQNYIHDFLRNYTKQAPFVLEGREMSSVFPDAKYHFYFFANPVARAMDRIKKNNLSLTKGEFDDLCERIRKRDEKDMCRENNPLRIPEDAIMIDVGRFEFEYTEILKHVIDLIGSSYEVKIHPNT